MKYIALAALVVTACGNIATTDHYVHGTAYVKVGIDTSDLAFYFGVECRRQATLTGKNLSDQEMQDCVDGKVADFLEQIGTK